MKIWRRPIFSRIMRRALPPSSGWSANKLELEFQKGALHARPRRRSEPTSAITGPAASPSQKDVG